MRPVIVVWIAAGALALGIALEVLTWWLARSGPEGGPGAPWSLRGNGALIVPVGLGPALLAGTWTALVLHGRGAVHWRGLGLAAGLFGIGLLLASMLALVGFGRSYAGQVASSWLSLGVLAWMPVAPILATVVPVRRRTVAFHRGMHALAGVLGTVLFVGAFIGAGRVLPPGS